MKHLKKPFIAFARYTGKQFKWVCCWMIILLISLVVIPNVNEAYSAGEAGETLYAVSPLHQQMKLTQPTTSAPGGRGFMLPQTVIVKDTSGKPVAGVSVTFEVSANDMITSLMRGYNSRVITVTTNSNGMASAANTNSNYLGEGYQVYSLYPGLVQALQVKASIPGGTAVTFNVEVGTYNSNIVDKTPPFISVNAKEDTGADYVAGTWTNHSVSVSYSATDSLSTIKSCTAEQTFTEEGANQSSTGTAVDSSNNSASITFGPICIDKSKPVTTASYSKPKSGGWYDNKVAVRFESTDNLSGVKAMFYKVDDRTPVKLEGQNALVDIDIEGASSISYWSVDNAGNEEQAKSFVLKIDRSVPTITSILSPEKNESGWNKYEVTLTLSAQDVFSGVKEIHFKVGETGEEKIIIGDTTSIFFNTEGITTIYYWAIDNANKSSSVENVVVKLDKSLPVVTPPKDITVEATAVKTPVNIGKATVLDISEWTLEAIAPEDGYPVGTTKVIWKATDSVGFVSQVVQNITVTDKTKPVLTVQSDIVVEATAVETPVKLEQATATDIFDVTITNDAPDKYKLGDTYVTWTAKDANNNEVSTVQKVTVIDSIAPVLTPSEDITIEATGRRTHVDLVTPSAIDIFKVTITNNGLPDYPIGTTYVTWKARDDNNNISEDVQQIKVQDTTKPQLTIPEDIIMEAPSRSVKLDIGDASATDIFDVTVSNNAPAVFEVGTTEVKWTAVDENKNVEEKIQRITITDKTKPVITQPSDMTVEATGELTFVPIEPPSVYDIFDTNYSRTGPKDNMFPVGHTVITWTFTDVNGNSASCDQHINVRDTTKPLVTLPKDLTIEATGRRTPVDIGEPLVTEIFSYELKNNAPEEGFKLGNTPVKWEITDKHGNKTEGIQNIKVVDTTNPVLNVPEDKRVEATAVLTPVDIGIASATDIFDVSITNNDLKQYPLGTTVVTWSAKDESKNEDTRTQIITVVDTTAPVISVPPDITVEATAEKTPVELLNAEAWDIFTVTVTNNAPKEGFGVGTTDVKWTATDANGNSSSGIQKVTVTDKTAPVLKVPGNISVEATARRTPVDIGQATAEDIFKVNVISNGTGDYPLGRTIVTWTATDANGNATTGTQEITVTDKTPPEIAPPKDVTVEAKAVITEVVDIGQASAIDIFDIKKIWSNAPGVYPLGTTTVTWSAIDVNDNKSECTQKVTIVDTIPPELTAPADKTVEAKAAEGTTVELGTPVYSDIFEVTVSNDAPKLFQIGTTKVTWTAVDKNNNETEKVQYVTVQDTIPPELTAPADKTAEATAVAGTPVNLGTPVYSDIFEVTVSNDAPKLFQIGTTKVTWTAVDKNNNKTEKIQYVKVQDTIPPELTAPADKTAEATAVAGTPVNLGTPVYSDIFEVTVSNDAPKLFQIGTTKVTWTAVDKNNNKTEKIQYVKVQDTIPPELTAPADKTAEATAVAGTPVNLGTPVYSDIFEVTVSNDAPKLFQIGTTKVTWTAVDKNNNKTEKIQYVTVQDTTKPRLTVPADITVPATGSRTRVQIGMATATDIFKTTVTSNAPVDFPVGTTIVIWTATDENGNYTTGTQKITVVQSVKVSAYNITKSNSVNTIDPYIMVENTGDTEINLSDIKIRYYYTVEGDIAQTYYCDYASVSGSGSHKNITTSVSGKFNKVTGNSGCDYYLEICFSSSAGVLKPGEKVIVQNRFSKINWSNYTQGNDYSFNPTATEYTVTSKITVYSSGILIGGMEP